MTASSFKLKIIFENPLEISPNFEQDRLVLKFLNLTLITSPQIGQMLNSNYKILQSKIKRQIPDNDFTQAIQTSATSSNAIGLAILIVSACINLLITGRALNSMVMLIRSLQIVLHLPMFYVLFPGNVMMVFDAIRPLVAFDLLNLVSGPDEIGEYD